MAQKDKRIPCLGVWQGRVQGFGQHFWIIAHVEALAGQKANQDGAHEAWIETFLSGVQAEHMSGLIGKLPQLLHQRFVDAGGCGCLWVCVCHMVVIPLLIIRVRAPFCGASKVRYSATISL
jgi:hypothetical protein